MTFLTKITLLLLYFIQGDRELYRKNTTVFPCTNVSEPL